MPDFTINGSIRTLQNQKKNESDPRYRGEVFDLTQGICILCKKPLDFDLFIVEGGQPSCLPCSITSRRNQKAFGGATLISEKPPIFRDHSTPAVELGAIPD